MSETDPFADAAFASRLQKLVPMLGSEQPGEAEAARRKIQEHLSHYRLSFTDLSNYLRDRAGAPPRPSFSQGARELMLERQLAVARVAKEEAEAEADAALARIRVLEFELQQAAFDASRDLNGQARVRGAAALACTVAVGCVIFVALSHNGAVKPVTLPAEAHSRVVMVEPQEPATADPVLHLMAGERPGSAAVQDLAIRLNPNDQGTIRAFLNYGDKVAIQQRVRVGPQTWLLIRSATGVGWVRSGDVLQ